MKQLHGSAAGESSAPVGRCFEFLADVERYPSWYPEVVRELEVIERDPAGTPVLAETTLHIAYGPLVRDLPVRVAVRLERPVSVTLTRVAHGEPDQEELQVSWRLRERGAGASIDLQLHATLAVPRMIPIGSIGDALASGFLGAALAALEKPSA